MNQHLQHILDIIQQDDNLTSEQKDAILKSVKDANKDFDITGFNLDRTEKVERTTASLLEEAIEELEQKRKAVDAQNKELEIEAALERVRSRSMAMHKSEELKEVIQVVYEQFICLNINIEHTGFIIDYDEASMHIWLADQFASPFEIIIPYFDSPHWNSFNAAKKKGEKFFDNLLTFEEKNKFYQDLFKLIPALPEESRQSIFNKPGLAISTVLLDSVGLYIENFSGIPYTEEENTTLLRFGNVFQQTYTRFLDLQKAEAQARDAQVEAALEKVRSASLAMHHSDELEKVVAAFCDKLVELGLCFDGSFIYVFEREKRNILIWVATKFLAKPVKVNLPYSEEFYENQIIKDLFGAVEKGEHIFNKSYSGKTKNDYFLYASKFNESTIPEDIRTLQLDAQSWTVSFVGEKNSVVGFDSWSGQITTSDDFQILKRFSKVFEQAYTRFLDLQKAEAQAREAQIESALERVRSRTMAMRGSEELLEVASILFQQVKALGVPQWNCGFNIWEIGDEEFTYYPGAPDGIISQSPCKIPLTEHPVFQRFDESRKRGDELLVYEKEGEMQRGHYQYMLSLPGVGDLLQSMLDAGFEFPSFQIDHVANFAYGNLIFITYEHFPEMHDVFKRFAKVFEQTYTRFLDLQKAEAQAREAEIQLSLERVRARGMAMYNSNELADLLDTVFRELTKLDIRLDRCIIMIYDPKTYSSTWWMSTPVPGAIPVGLFVKYHQYKPYLDYLKAWENRILKWEYLLEGNNKMEWDSFIFSETELSRLPEFAINGMKSFDSIYLNVSFNNFGSLTVSTAKPLDEAGADLLLRFAKVFDSTYTRFIDLQKAEAQAKEAQIEAALERVRAVAMSMMKSDDLLTICQSVFTQLQVLGFENIRVAQIYIRNDEEEKFLNYDYAGVTGAVKVEVNYNSHPNTRRIYDVIRNAGDGLVYNVIEKEKLDEWKSYLYNTLRQQPEENLHAADGLHYYLYSFGIGAFGICTFKAISQEELDILKRFRNVFNLSYQRYADIALAEAQLREAQIETSLERVRSKTMAMHNSVDVGETVATLFDELVKLGVHTNRCGILINSEGSMHAEVWTAKSNPAGKANLIIGQLDLTMHPLLAGIYQAWKSKEPVYIYPMIGDDLIAYYQAINNTKYYPTLFDLDTLPSKEFHTDFYFAEGSIFSFTPELLTEEASTIFKRFAGVFGQTYTRFLDLQRAEAQARESQIQLALERVRARTMAMQHSGELREIAAAVHDQLLGLGFTSGFCSIVIMDRISGDMTWWMFFPGKEYPESYHMPFVEHSFYLEQLNNWKEGKKYSVIEVSGQEKKSYDEYTFGQTEFKNIPIESQRFMMAFEKIIFSNAYMKHGAFSWGVEPIDEEHSAVLQRFASVFEQCYTRFLDLQKAEAQAREAQIEVSLERVRARTMAMHNSEDVSTATATMFAELEMLGIENIRGGITIISPDQMQEVWSITNLEDGKTIRSIGIFDMRLHPFWQEIFKGWQNKEPFQLYWLGGKDKEDYINILNDTPNYLSQPIEEIPDVYIQSYFFGEGAVWANSIEPHSAEDKQIMKRFASVFSLTFRRYRDLQKAEAQAREAQIEASLERVRSKTMAMHSSLDVGDTIATLFDEFIKLGMETFRCGIGIVHGQKRMELWTAKRDADENVKFFTGYMNMNMHPMLAGAYSGWEQKQETYVYDLKGEDLKEYFTRINNNPNYPLKYDISSLPYRLIFSVFYFPEGFVFAFTQVELPTEAMKIFKRFSGVFGQTYRRYRDLQKAEAQAREAQIEAALERVRSRSLAMHHSSELSSVVDTLLQEFTNLEFTLTFCIINLIDSDNLSNTVWAANPETGKNAESYYMKFEDYDFHRAMWNAWKAQDKRFVYTLEGKEKKLYDEYLYSETEFRRFPKHVQEANKALDRYVAGFTFFKYSGLQTVSVNEITEADLEILERFGKVFEQAYTRFLDLQKAEAQAREATIEAALEKVRGKAMAMHNSSDLTATASVVFTELRKLGINPIRCGVGLLNKENRKAQIYSATSSTEGDSLSLVGWVQLSDHPVLEQIYNSWQLNEDYYPQLTGEELKTYYQKLLSGFPIPIDQFASAQKHYGHFISFSVGALYAWSEKEFDEEKLRIFKRFASIIDLTFRRYIELQKSETNAREAVKQAALDRIRADIASMRTISDLDRITPLIWNELTILGIPFIRCGVFIMDDSQQLIHTFLSTPEGKAIAAFHLPYTTPGNIQQVLSNWLDKKNYIEHWNEKAFVEFANTLVEEGALVSTDQYLSTIPHGGFCLHFLPFLQGMLYVGNTTQLNDDEINLIQSVADAFSTAYARYEDFNKLEAAKQQVDKTLTDLKLTQAQLIQSEKMASLGELTAGIAHEIQNPLNFVNNFSDVSAELIDEMNEEIAKGNLADAKQIAGDLKQNLEKINHHGKRAGDIVRGMLQHSRRSNGNKEPTDINKLADEYLRLAYHGLRAKDKSFNATLKTEFDESIGDINIIPQDIGRVILNLITNAFYAVDEKKNSGLADYEPNVTITTKKLANKVEIAVMDNGNGIPQKIVDKIFQPFFTTKPTGQGTGLGLSLAYDIVKAHGGELKVETKPAGAGSDGEGGRTSFVVLLPFVFSKA